MKITRRQLKKILLREFSMKPRPLELNSELSEMEMDLKKINSSYSIKAFYSHDNVILRFFDENKQITAPSTVGQISKILDKKLQQGQTGSRILSRYNTKDDYSPHVDYVGDEEAAYREGESVSDKILDQI